MGAAYVLWRPIRGKKTFDEAAIRGFAAQQLQSVYFSLALLPTTNCFQMGIVAFSTQLLLHFAACQLFQTVHQSCLSSRFLLRPPSAYLYVCCLPLSTSNLFCLLIYLLRSNHICSVCLYVCCCLPLYSSNLLRGEKAEKQEG